MILEPDRSLKNSEQMGLTKLRAAEWPALTAADLSHKPSWLAAETEPGIEAIAFIAKAHNGETWDRVEAGSLLVRSKAQKRKRSARGISVYRKHTSPKQGAGSTAADQPGTNPNSVRTGQDTLELAPGEPQYHHGGCREASTSVTTRGLHIESGRYPLG